MMKNNSKLYLIVAIILNVFLPSLNTVVNAQENVLNYATSIDVTSFDPRNGTSTPTSALLTNIYSSLVTSDENRQIINDLAESYEQIDDLTYHFKLKEGVKFHNGEDLTSEDVKYTFDSIRAKGATYSLGSDFTYISIEVIDDYNFYLKTDYPSNSTLLRLIAVKIIPKDYVEEVGDEEFALNPIGSGPFKFVSHVKDDSVVLESFEDYFGGQPSIDRLVNKIIPETTSRIAALQAGEVDLISGVNINNIETLESSGFNISSKETTRLFYFRFNLLEDSPLQDVRVRQAINYVIDQDAIVNQLFEGHAKEIKSISTDAFYGYDENIEGFGYDIEQAKKLLKEAGYENGFELEIAGTFSTTPLVSDVAQYVSAQLKEIGINATVIEKDSQIISDEIISGTTSELTLGSWGGAYNDIALMAEQVFGTGGRNSSYSNEEFDKLTTEAISESDPEKSLVLFSEIQQYYVDNALALLLYQPEGLYAYSDRVEGWVPRQDEMLLFKDVTLNQ